VPGPSWLIPAEREETYDDCMRKLVDYRFVRAEDYIDFGPVPAIPEEEFLGAGVWQLYKGIDAPWKSILKLLLIECYARTTGEALLSSQFKRAVFRGETDADRLDPYVMLYNRLEGWLTGPEVASRLDLIRRSLYLKASLPLTRSEVSGEQWRARLLRQIKGFLWNGNLHNGQAAIEDLVIDLEVVETDYASIKALRKAASEFETYIANNALMIPNYSERRR